MGFQHQTAINQFAIMSGVEQSSDMNIISKVIQHLVRNNIRNPKYRWVMIAASLLYLVSPLDFAPDFMPVLGWLDDGVVVTLLATELSQFLIERRNARKGDASSATVGTATVNTATVG